MLRTQRPPCRRSCFGHTIAVMFATIQCALMGLTAGAAAEGGCRGGGISCSITPLDATGLPVVGTVEPGDLIIYRLTLSQPLPNGCDVVGGRLSLVLPGGTVVEVAGFGGDTPPIPQFSFVDSICFGGQPPHPCMCEFCEVPPYAVVTAHAEDGMLTATLIYEDGTITTNPPGVANCSISVTTPVAAKGACCFGDGTCAVVLQAPCEEAGGTFLGEGTVCPGVDCPTMGACCFETAPCEDNMMPEACAAGGGYYQGNDSTCEPDLCPPPKGACCFADGSCAVLLESLCQADGGMYQGDSSTCVGQCASGACCAPGQPCMVVDPAACAQAGGDYQGPGTSCEPDPCGPLASGADLNGDGTVDVQDLLLLIMDWGCSGVCSADVNQDAHVDVDDLIMIINSWD